MKFFIFCFVLLGYLELSTIHRIELLKKTLFFLSQIKTLNISSLNAILDMGVLNSYQTKKILSVFPINSYINWSNMLPAFLTWLLFFFVGKETLLYSGGWQPGKKADSIQKPTPNILMDHGSFQREKRKLIILWEGQRLHYLPLCPDFLLIGW